MNVPSYIKAYCLLSNNYQRFIVRFNICGWRKYFASDTPPPEEEDSGPDGRFRNGFVKTKILTYILGVALGIFFLLGTYEVESVFELFRFDRMLHFVVGFLLGYLGKMIGLFLVFLLGLGKEIFDFSNQRNFFDSTDYMMTVIGGVIGMITRMLQSMKRRS